MPVMASLPLPPLPLPRSLWLAHIFCMFVNLLIKINFRRCRRRRKLLITITIKKKKYSRRSCCCSCCRCCCCNSCGVDDIRRSMWGGHKTLPWQWVTWRTITTKQRRRKQRQAQIEKRAKSSARWAKKKNKTRRAATSQAECHAHFGAAH